MNPLEVIFLPKIGSVWKHHRGGIYRVINVLNLHSENHEKFPVMIAYEDGDGKTWCRPASEWHKSFTPFTQI